MIGEANTQCEVNASWFYGVKRRRRSEGLEADISLLSPPRRRRFVLWGGGGGKSVKVVGWELDEALGIEVWSAVATWHRLLAAPPSLVNYFGR
ncbi:LOW QUALITY PROTEIN: hypothetical protein PanWU01x14_219360 [Parasponia andersonii]|uniref:Uncharacterized protein n=1 Tax=Parasponia andersonii TaxID=3476 RepID=A0A2P5BQL1_PARAD|nr:LOW QUALITY PROTEIN: hypothetical protein PanWU01x14_219360 [Parasponia andersonii]